MKREEFESTIEDMKSIKAELDVLKNTVKTLTFIKQEGKVLKKYIDNLKEEVKQLMTENTKAAQKIRNLEEEVESNSDDSSEDDETATLTRKSVVTQIKTNTFESANALIKCEKCGYSCKNEITFRKHMTTKHPALPEVPDNFEDIEKNTNEINYEAQLEDIDECFQIEIFNGEQVFACNICDEGFDNDDEIRKHISNNHKETVRILSSEQEYETYEEDKEDMETVCEEDICLDKGNGKCGNICKYLID